MPIPGFDLGLEIRGPEGVRKFDNASIGLNQFAKDIEAAVSFREINPILQRILHNFLKAAADAMAKRHNTPWTPNQDLPTGNRSGKLATRSGKSMQAIRDSVAVKSDGKKGVSGQIGGPFYLVTQEEGRTIRGKNTKGGYMAIPLADALDAKGVPRRPGPRSWENTFVRPLPKGGFIILQKAGGRILKLYALKKTVIIPPRLGLGETLKIGSKVMVEKLFEALTIHIATKAVTGRNVNPAGFI